MPALIRIGALASRTGVSTHVLRVWEERYRLFEPERTTSGYRLYGPEDERRVRLMLRLRGQGVSAAEAAAAVLRADVTEIDDLEAMVPALRAALTTFDESGAGAVMDPALADYDLEEVIRRLFFPCLRYLGEAWADGRITVGQEHFASNAIRRRMMAQLTPALGAPPGPQAPTVVLACTPHERHDIGLLALALLLARHGWRAVFLGADTPISSTLDAGEDLGARLLVLCGTEPHMFAAQLDQATDELARRPAVRALAIGGAAAAADLADRHGAVLLDADPLAAAAQLVAVVPVTVG